MTCRGENAFCCDRQPGQCRAPAGVEVVLSGRIDETRERVDARALLSSAAAEALSNIAVRVDCLLCNMDAIVQSVG
jgi:hypothetical protein